MRDVMIDNAIIESYTTSNVRIMGLLSSIFSQLFSRLFPWADLFPPAHMTAEMANAGSGLSSVQGPRNSDVGLVGLV
jgi:hypothetical protein